MAGFFQDLLQGVGAGFFGNDTLRDYTHASKTFRSDSYANAPKYKFVFHTYFNINPEAYPQATEKNFGILVKDVKLPSYSFNTVQLNQYNRKRIVQTKIRYEPISVSFHDDNNNTINKLWYAYYTYYYADATKPTIFLGKRGAIPPKDPTAATTQSTNADYNVPNIYDDSIQGNDNWGYIGETNKLKLGHKVPFFNNITVFGFNQHNFTAYTLVNPIITSFGHDTYNYAEGGGTMTNNMSIDYETVVYNEGAMAGNSPGDIVTGFGDEANYDRRTSPIAMPGANNSILGPYGILDGLGGAVQDLGEGNILGAIQKAGAAYKTSKNMDLKTNIKQELGAMAQSAVDGFGSPVSTNRNMLFDIPNKSATPYFIGTAGAPTISQNPSNPSPLSEVRNAGAQVRK